MHGELAIKSSQWVCLAGYRGEAHCDTAWQKLELPLPLRYLLYVEER